MYRTNYNMHTIPTPEFTTQHTSIYLHDILQWHTVFLQYCTEHNIEPTHQLYMILLRRSLAKYLDTLHTTYAQPQKYI